MTMRPKVRTGVWWGFGVQQEPNYAVAQVVLQPSSQLSCGAPWSHLRRRRRWGSLCIFICGQHVGPLHNNVLHSRGLLAKHQRVMRWGIRGPDGTGWHYKSNEIRHSKTLEGWLSRWHQHCNVATILLQVTVRVSELVEPLLVL